MIERREVKKTQDSWAERNRCGPGTKSTTSNFRPTKQRAAQLGKRNTST